MPAEALWYIDCPKSERYHYKTFDDQERIRIMVLLPGGPKKPIRCKLSTVPVRDAPCYEAISYVWGERRGAMLCDGKRLEVPLNLAHALIRFRHKTESCLLWADAVCINQNNITERGHQMQMMGDVFRKAERVLVWLGRDGEPSAKKMFDIVNACFPLPPPHELRARIRQSMLQDRELTQHWNRFFSNDWFERMWIVQEIGLPSEATLYCGEASVEWEILARVLQSFMIFRATVSPRSQPPSVRYSPAIGFKNAQTIATVYTHFSAIMSSKTTFQTRRLLSIFRSTTQYLQRNFTQKPVRK